MSKYQRGFTLIELIVVIVILGILAATALPRFVGLQSDAKAATMKGLAGGLRASVELVRARWLVTGSASATTVQMADGTNVTVSTAPAAAAGVAIAQAGGIDNALGSTSGYTFTAAGTPTGIATFTPAGGPAGCSVTYNGSNGIVVDTAAIAANC